MNEGAACRARDGCWLCVLRAAMRPGRSRGLGGRKPFSWHSARVAETRLSTAQISVGMEATQDAVGFLCFCCGAQ